MKWIDLLINSLFNNDSQIKMLDRQIVKWQKELLYFYRCDNHFHISFSRLSTTLTYKEEKNLRDIEEKHTTKLGTIRQIIRLFKIKRFYV